MDIYLDNSATTPVLPQAAQLALDVMGRQYGNPSSLHRKGFDAQLLLEQARAQVAGLLEVPEDLLLFTPSGTVANNLVLLGVARAALRRQKRQAVRIISTAIEHASVLRPLEELAKEGAQVVLVGPDSAGHIDPQEIIRLVDGNTLLVSAMAVNSETGAVTDMEKLAQGVGQKNPDTLIHCDGVQAFGKLPFSPRRLGLDFVTVSGHKIGAPKGIGALYRAKGRRGRLSPLWFGGGQEGQMASGTENMPAIAAFGCAAAHWMEKSAQHRELFARLHVFLTERLTAIPQVCSNSPPNAAPYIMNLSVPGIRSETMIHFLAQRQIYVSGGSACAKGAKSHVLAAMGLPDDRIDSALRLSFGPQNTTGDLEAFAAALEEGIRTLAQKPSPAPPRPRA